MHPGFKKIFCNRGVPKLILSGDGSQFISLAKETQNFTAKEGITQKFNLAAAPWWGDLFEWFVRSIKRCLKKIFKNFGFNYHTHSSRISHLHLCMTSQEKKF